MSRRRRARSRGLTAEQLVEAVAANGILDSPPVGWSINPVDPGGLLVRDPEQVAASKAHRAEVRKVLAGLGYSPLDLLRAQHFLAHPRPGYLWDRDHTPAPSVTPRTEENPR